MQVMQCTMKANTAALLLLCGAVAVRCQLYRIDNQDVPDFVVNFLRQITGQPTGHPMVSGHVGHTNPDLSGEGVCVRKVDRLLQYSQSMTYLCARKHPAYGLKLCKHAQERHGYALVPAKYCCKGYTQIGHTCHKEHACHGCPHLCTTRHGHASCACFPGYNMPHGHCQDINECNTHNGGCAHNCHNTMGSYMCSCREGYLLASDKSCKDIDECAVGNGGCEHDCHNHHDGGSYCSCRHGFTRTMGFMCLPDTASGPKADECQLFNGGCSQVCVVQPSGHQCSCYDGYKLASDRRTCRPDNGADKDEDPSDSDHTGVIVAVVLCVLLLLLILFLCICARKKGLCCFAAAAAANESDEEPPYSAPEGLKKACQNDCFTNNQYCSSDTMKKHSQKVRAEINTVSGYKSNMTDKYTKSSMHDSIRIMKENALKGMHYDDDDCKAQEKSVYDKVRNLGYDDENEKFCKF